jgi:hypothetical protein
MWLISWAKTPASSRSVSRRARPSVIAMAASSRLPTANAFIIAEGTTYSCGTRSSPARRASSSTIAAPSGNEARETGRALYMDSTIFGLTRWTRRIEIAPKISATMTPKSPPKTYAVTVRSASEPPARSQVCAVFSARWRSCSKSRDAGVLMILIWVTGRPAPRAASSKSCAPPAWQKLLLATCAPKRPFLYTRQPSRPLCLHGPGRCFP